MRRILSVAVSCVAALMAACSSPSSNLYTLSPSAAAIAAEAPCNCSVVVGPVSIPAIDNGPQIVVNTGPNQVSWTSSIAGRPRCRAISCAWSPRTW